MDLIQEILSLESANDVINELKNKTIYVRPWSELEKEYDKKKHPVYDTKLYPDVIKKDGTLIKQCRVAFGMQKLAVKRIGEMCFGIPVKRIYSPTNDKEKRASKILEAIFEKNRINSVNLERSKYFYASCEFATIWYTQKAVTDYAGERSDYKIRCKTYSPMTGTSIYPLFDEYDDLVALSLDYSRKKGDKTTKYFETYTAKKHIRWKNESNVWEEEINDDIDIEKIAGIYAHRDEPIWEDESENVYEMEWQLSREGNYLRKNLKPKWVVCTDKEITFGKEDNSDTTARDVVKYPGGAEAGYKTWDQAIDSLKYHIETLRQNFFAQLQLPEMSSDAMKSMPMSAESRKMIFIDGQLKVTDESGIWLDAFYREINVVKAIAKKRYPDIGDAFDSLRVKVDITPYQIQDIGERIEMYSNATGKPVMSTRNAVSRLGLADDVDEEIQSIIEDGINDLSGSTL